MTGRSVGAIAQRVNRLVGQGRLPLACGAGGGGNCGGGAGGHPVSWSPAEDEALIAAINAGDAAGLSRTVTQSAAAAAIPGRTLGAVQSRVNHLVAAGRVDRVHAAHGAWTAPEDEALAAFVRTADAAGQARNAACAAFAAACVPPRSAAAVWQHVYKLVAAGRLPGDPAAAAAAAGGAGAEAGAEAAALGLGAGEAPDESAAAGDGGAAEEAPLVGAAPPA